jgi:hypothetical protein
MVYTYIWYTYKHMWSNLILFLCLFISICIGAPQMPHHMSSKYSSTKHHQISAKYDHRITEGIQSLNHQINYGFTDYIPPHTYIYIYIYIYINYSKYIYVHTNIHKCINVYIQISIFMSIFINLNIYTVEQKWGPAT